MFGASIKSLTDVVGRRPTCSRGALQPCGAVSRWWSCGAPHPVWVVSTG